MRSTWIALAGLLGLAQAQAQVINNPAEFAWEPATDTSGETYYTGTLVYGEATFTISGETLTTRAYAQEAEDGNHAYSIPGPTMVMEPGKKYVVRFKNLLPYTPAQKDVHNVMKDPDVTNLHTHGLHISGESPGDDVTRFFEGQRGGDFVYDIPADHMGGTFWYHAHHHGSTFLQVSSGALGLIIIDDSQDGIPASVAAMEEKHLAIAYLDPSVAGSGGDTLISGTLGATWTVNGQVNGTLTVPADEWQHWRILLADADSRVKTLSIDSSCEMQLLARDGVWRRIAPLAVPSNSINITGASRADFAVKCWGNSSIAVNGGVVANVAVGAAGDAAPNPLDNGGTWSALRPDYLRDLRGETVDNSETVRMGARTINGSKFDMMQPTFTMAANGLQEWSINGARNHPFHLHVYHVQVQGDCPDFEDGEYYDVIAGNCTVRFDLDAYTSLSDVYSGKTIMHCHILEHEDQGAMGWLKVLADDYTTGAPVFPTGSFDTYYELGGGNPPDNPPAAPSDLTATAASSSAINLLWTDNSSDETRFDLQRSNDGTNFSPLASVGANSTTYTDSNLTPATTYHYQVSAANAAGSSAPSNPTNATTEDAPAGTSLQVGSLVVSTVSAGPKGVKAGRADILVIDDQGAPVAGATVTGAFSGDLGTASTGGAPTDTNGATFFETVGSSKGKIALTFCVTSITHSTLATYTGTPADCASL